MGGGPLKIACNEVEAAAGGGIAEKVKGSLHEFVPFAGLERQQPTWARS